MCSSDLGYDRVESALTIQLQEEGIDIHYDDNVELIPNEFMDKDSTLVVYTPAIPNTLIELNYFKECDFTIMKRSQVLGEITRMWKGICVAGTHGKTTTSTMTAHLLHNSHVDCNAFIGGISNNFKQNIHLSEKSDLVVIEADEYDRSFLTLNPYVAIITSVDADHLDIYNDESDYRATFEKFTSLIVDNGILLMKKDLPIKPKVKKNVTSYTYSANDNDADYYAINVRIEDGNIDFDLVTPTSIIENIRLGVPVSINIENGIAAMAVALLNGVTEQEVKDSMASYAGVKRRFDFHIKNEDIVLIDDYAHHPEELKACISSVRALYPNKKITGIFQPHLFTRTRDFADEFAQNLSKLDEIILLDIYPSREVPI